MRGFRSSILMACALPAFLCGQAHQEKSDIPILLNEAVVRGATVELSDLLPGNVASDLRLTAQTINLGRAPEPGSFRVFTLEQLRNAIHGRAAVEIPAQVTVHRAGWPISPDRIREAVNATVPTANSARITLPPELSARSPDAKLRVREIRLGRDARTLMAQLGCRERRDCAPFWAQLVFAQPVQPWGAMRNVSAASFSITTKPLVRPGRPALLICDTGGLRISMRVFPLRRAGLGDTVKVLDRATGRTVLAVVRGTDLLQSDLRETR